MKACLLLQRHFAYIGHNLALHLRDTYGVDEFCGYVYLRSSYTFLKTQKEIPYTNLLLDQDLHDQYIDEKLDLDFLNKLEKEYGIPYLWPFIAVDRVVMHGQLVREYPYDTAPYTYDEMLRIVQVKAKAVLKFLETEKPDFVFFSVIGGIGSMLLYHIAKRKGIPTLVVHPTSIRDTYVLSAAYDGLTGVEKVFTEFKQNGAPTELAEKSQKFIDEFRNQPLPHYELADPAKLPTTRRKQLNFLLPSKLTRYIRWLAISIRRHYQQEDRGDYDYISPWNYFKDGFKRKLRNAVGVNDLYDAYDPTVPFVFFPLHYEPEITLLLYAPYFTDQLHLVENIAKSLPVGYWLYVKEHPAMVPYRTRQFYKRLKKIPNVKLLDPQISSFQIIPIARLITTITSSVGWEASLLKKPVITFGNIFYNQLSFVKKCRALEDLPKLVKEQLDSFAFDENELVSFISAIFDESTNLNLQYLWEREKDEKKRKIGLKPLADLIARKLNLKSIQ